MRRRRSPTTPDAAPTPAAPDPAAAGSSYDWTRFGRDRFRTPGAVVVDNPLPAAGPRWMASVWPDSRVPGGSARMVWQPDPEYGRGWLIPARLALGDRLEFGADGPGGLLCWYGILDSYEVAAWLTAQGLYPDQATAHRPHPAWPHRAPMRGPHAAAVPAVDPP
jgi:hypothetical protein